MTILNWRNPENNPFTVDEYLEGHYMVDPDSIPEDIKNVLADYIKNNKGYGSRSNYKIIKPDDSNIKEVIKTIIPLLCKDELIYIMNYTAVTPLTELNIKLDCIDLSNVTNLNGVFESLETEGSLGYKKYKIKYINLNSWDTSGIIEMRGTFENCRDFEVFINEWDTSNVTNMKSIFNNSNLMFNISSWNVENLENAASAFSNAKVSCSLKDWKPIKLERALSMFIGCNAENINIKNWELPSLKYARHFTDLNTLGVILKDNYLANLKYPNKDFDIKNYIPKSWISSSTLDTDLQDFIWVQNQM